MHGLYSVYIVHVLFVFKCTRDTAPMYQFFATHHHHYNHHHYHHHHTRIPPFTTNNAGEGRVHECLTENLDKLTEACRMEEMKISIIQSQDVRLRPKLNKLCSEEMVIYCKDVKPGMYGGWHESGHACAFTYVWGWLMYM